MPVNRLPTEKVNKVPILSDLLSLKEILEERRVVQDDNASKIRSTRVQAPISYSPDTKSKLVLNPHPGYNPRQKSRIRLLFSECLSMA